MSKIVTYADLQHKLDAMTLIAMRRHDALVKQQRGIARLHRRIEGLQLQLTMLALYSEDNPGLGLDAVWALIEKDRREIAAARKKDPGELGAAMGCPCPDEMPAAVR